MADPKAVDTNVIDAALYDALIVACAKKAGATRILTFNRRQFEALVGDDMRVVVPGEPEDT